MNSPLVSVVMPVYNAEKYLKEAVESILNQTFTDFEFIITNDGSTDKSGEILRQYQNIDSRIKLIEQNNMGLTRSLNNMLSIAQGDFIARMDADDIALPERFQRQVAFLQKNSNYVAVGSKVLLIDEDGCPIMPFSQLTTHDEIDQAHLKGTTGSFINHPSVMIRTEAMKKIDGYRVDLEPAEDLDLFLRLAEIGKINNIDQILLKYRVHLKSVGHSRRLAQIKSANRAVMEAHQRRGLNIPDFSICEPHQPSINETYRKWGWWALSAKNLHTARKYAWLALKQEPLSSANWKLVFCVLRGY